MQQMTRARARLALRKAVGAYLFESNIGLIDFGAKEVEGELHEEELAIRVHVHEKLSGFELQMAEDQGRTKEVPESIEGFPTDVVEGVYQPQQWGWGGSEWWRRSRSSDPRASRGDPMKGGVSVCDEYRYGYGTLGGLVRDRGTGEEMLLSNWHVLVGSWSARPGQRIYQPGRSDRGTPEDTVAALTRHAMSRNLDAAVAQLTGQRRLINEQLGIGRVTGVRSLDFSDLGLEVIKSGRKTGVTRGRVTGIEGVQKMPYQGVSRLIRHVIAVDPLASDGGISDAGDSGSWWLARDTREVVGLHFAGSNRPERALAMDIQMILDALNVEVVI
jgi:hypothetical protein